jgi:hypothetical protein
MPLQKLCNKCQQNLPHDRFYKNARMRDGLNTFCIACHRADNVARKKVNRTSPAFSAAEREYKKAYREQTGAERAAYMKQWRSLNAEARQAYGRKYRSDNAAFVAFLCQKRKIDKANRTPSWLDSDDLWMIEQAYELAAVRTKLFGFSWHVDHIVPLRGKRVSGLHVPLNLQVIPGVDNIRKNNSFTGI